MYQGSKSIEEYYEDKEVTLMRANVLKSNEATMTQFLHGLNKEIQDVVKMYHYTSLDDLVHQATQVESQQRRRLASRPIPMVLAVRKGKKERKNDLEKTRVQRREVPHHEVERMNIHHLAFVLRTKVCLGKGHIASQCPNKRNMVMGEDGSVESESSCKESLSNSEVESSSDSSLNEGDLLMMTRLMNAQVNEDSDFQREFIFHSRCHVKGKLCSIIIYSGGCVNVASLRLVQNLNLPTLVHSRPYKL
ncbi:hypothetical protein CR513_36671, partial [Mucuna pruriens]